MLILRNSSKGAIRALITEHPHAAHTSAVTPDAVEDLLGRWPGAHLTHLDGCDWLILPPRNLGASRDPVGAT